MTEEKKITRKNHSIILENRHALSISGVSDVDSFDEESVALFTELGLLTVRGRDLHINRLNIENGEVQIDGEIDALEYTGETEKRVGFFARMMR